MLYLISDIHGDVTSFRKMLNKISFDPAMDHMIVMGDIFDWNDEGISLLEFMSDYLVDGSMQLMSTDFSSHLISTMFRFRIRRHLTGMCSADM